MVRINSDLLSVLRAVPAAQAIFLPKMWKHAGDYSVPACIAYPPLIIEPINIAIARAGTAFFEFFECGIHTRPERSLTIELHVGRFKILH
jgi:hypothetical protein